MAPWGLFVSGFLHLAQRLVPTQSQYIRADGAVRLSVTSHCQGRQEGRRKCSFQACCLLTLGPYFGHVYLPAGSSPGHVSHVYFRDDKESFYIMKKHLLLGIWPSLRLYMADTMRGHFTI